MKFNSFLLTVAAAGSMVAAQHHHSHHHHHVERDAKKPAYAYVLNGQPISQEQVCEGIARGTLAFADPNAPKELCQGSSSSTSSSSSSEPTSSATSSSSSSESSPTSSPSAGGGDDNSQGVDRDFPDGEIGCDSFPHEYGAVPLNYLGLSGWSGVQFVSIIGEAVSHISTAVSGETCKDGSMCSYACPAGYQKSQWPTTQGSTGQSVGGLACKNGKLHLTNPGLSKKLCIPGTGGVNVKNTLGDNVAVCRTDYPGKLYCLFVLFLGFLSNEFNVAGTESETIPLNVVGGASQPLTCPNGATYFKWQGKTTSAQYYVNNKGVSQEDACKWSKPGSGSGNFAPINLGVGESNGGKWLSMFRNTPTVNTNLNFNVRIDGDHLSGSCSYENGQFKGSGASGSGCTVSIPSTCSLCWILTD